MKRIRTHLSYANIMATIAVVFAMTGGAIAATGGFTSGGKLQACVNNEGRLKLLKSGERCKRGQKSVSWSQSGPAGSTGATGASGVAGANGAAGAAGPQGTALAYAHVLATGELDAAHSRNVSAASRPGVAGVYCLTVTVPVSNVNVTVDILNTLAADGTLTAGLSSTGDPFKGIETFCPAGTSALVQTRQEGKNTDLTFFATFN